MKDEKNILKIEDLKVYFPIKKGVLQKTVGHVKAVDGVTLNIRRGETLGLVGESRLRKNYHRPRYCPAEYTYQRTYSL